MTDRFPHDPDRLAAALTAAAMRLGCRDLAPHWPDTLPPIDTIDRAWEVAPADVIIHGLIALLERTTQARLKERRSNRNTAAVIDQFVAAARAVLEHTEPAEAAAPEPAREPTLFDHAAETAA